MVHNRVAADPEPRSQCIDLVASEPPGHKLVNRSRRQPPYTPLRQAGSHRLKAMILIRCRSLNRGTAVQTSSRQGDKSDR
jgi:hypothetical protein